MKSLSTALEDMHSGLQRPVSQSTKSHMPLPGSINGDGNLNTTLEIRQQSRSLQAKLATALPPSIEREIGMAQAGQWNLNRFAEIIAGSEALGLQLSEELDRLDYQMRPATGDEVKGCLAKLILHFPMLNMNVNEKTLLLEDYIAELGRFPAEIIRAVCREYSLSPENEFFPKAARLISACVGKYSILARRRKTIAAALEEGKRQRERRLSDKELDDIMGRVQDVETPKPTMHEKIEATLAAMRQSGAPEADIQEFLASLGAAA